MKKNIFNTGRFAMSAGALLLAGVSLSVTGCKEEIDESNFKIASEQTVSDFVAATDSLSGIQAVFNRVKLSKSDNASSITSVLSTRGNYTCFLPTNRALVEFVDSVTGVTETTPFEAMTQEEILAKVATLSDYEAKKVAYNAVIDNGTSSSYELADFPTDGETFGTTNLSDRRLSCEEKNGEFYYVNLTAKVIDWDHDLSNGTVHLVDKVVAPSDKSVADLIKDAPNMKVMAKLLQLTGWDEQLTLHTAEEEAYETEHAVDFGSVQTLSQVGNFNFADKRAVAFTAFVETDDVFAADWNVNVVKDANGEVSNWDEIYATIKQRCQAAYGAGEGDEKSSTNAVNKFMAYHFLEGGLSANEFVKHFNESGYDYVDAKNPQTRNLTVNVWDYYSTMGDDASRGLMKITQLPDGEKDYYINRISEYDDQMQQAEGSTTVGYGTYKELGIKSGYDNVPGSNGLNIKILRNNMVGEQAYDNNALNGWYFPINHVLVYDSKTREGLRSERIRIDLATMLPELASNDIRGKQVYYFPRGYFKNIMNESSGTKIFYLQNYLIGSAGDWKDLGGDEFIFSGRYDFVLKLPPVPADGTYEIRMAVSNNTLRGMAQIYIGEEPSKTEPCGLPIDMREQVAWIPGTPWVDDTNLDIATIQENDRNLRNQGYMKGPNYICVSQGKTSVRNYTPSTPALRRILIQKEMKANQTYYLRFKSALESQNSQFFVDYFEFVEKSIYSSDKPEDVW